MSDASPQWEYTWFHSAGDDALNEMMRKANALGKEGWEMVNFAVDERKPFTAVCFFKRPLDPGRVKPEPRRFL
ncbi:hypothetical protein [Mycobacterium sp.]|jgi:hypothetical protein|uniref:hypothetical protein n=1 Tax=Mycobacterium sp. TaxID=1785 RepID=UPI003C762689